MIGAVEKVAMSMGVLFDALQATNNRGKRNIKNALFIVLIVIKEKSIHNQLNAFLNVFYL